MAITVLLGKCGGGKTTRCFAQMKEWASNGGKALLIVPDQASYNAERHFAEYMGGKGFMGTQISGFSRLAYRVFLERSKEHAFLSELAQKIIFQRLLRRHEDEFSVLKTAASQAHFSETAARFIGECRSFCISPEALSAAAVQLEGQTLGRKLQDIALLYQSYTSFLQEHLGNADDMMTLLAKEVPSYSFIENAWVWIDGFLWFTPQQMAVIRAIESTAAHVTITLPMDTGRLASQARETALFHRPYAVYDELRRLFPQLDTEFIDEISAGEWIDHFFYPVPQSRDEAVPTLSLTECGSRMMEMDAAARRILALCRKGYRYRDFLILSRTGDDYYHAAEQVFSKYGIPFFSDYRRPMTAHPVVEAILSLLDVLTSGWSYEPLFGLLKTDLFPLSRRDVDELENYCLAYGIQGYHWLKNEEWTYRRTFYLEEEHSADKGEEEKLRRINEIRRFVAELLMPCWCESRDEHALSEWCTLLYQWLVRLHVPQTLRKWAQEDEEAGMAGESKEHEQVWKRILRFLDEIVRLCGNDTVSLQEFSQILSDGFGELKFSLIPPTLDHVILTSVERGYTMRARVVFLCGLNEGVFPKHNGEEGMLSDAERRHLGAMGLQLGPDSRFRSFQEKFLFYLAVTRASEELHLSYALADENGGAMEPSPWALQLEEKGYVAQITRQADESAPGKELIASVPSALSWLPVMIRSAAEGNPVGDVWWALYDWALLHGWKERTAGILKGLFYRNEPQRLSHDMVMKLYAPGGVLRSSVTKFEQYRKCPFAYFSRYGLMLEERQIYHFTAPDLGMLVHGALRDIGETLLAEKKQWRDLNKDEIAGICRQAAERLAPKVQHDILMSNAYFIQIKERLIRTLTRTVQRLCEFSAASRFRMEGLECSFGRKGSPWDAMQFALENGLQVIVSGQIDRIDTLRAGGKEYVVVIDYKSGQKKLDIRHVFHGLDLQLLLYMYVALLNTGPDALPAAILYCYVRDDKKPLDHIPGEDEKKKCYGEIHRLTGFYLNDGNVMAVLDTAMSNKSEFLELEVKKDGTVQNRSYTAYDEQGWNHLLNLVESRICEIAAAIDSGNIAVRPVLNGQLSSCRYCPYHAVCAFDEQLQGKYDVIVSMKKEDVVRKIDEEGGMPHGVDNESAGRY